MKVTVNFNGTKIVVPCGDGDITVRELTALAGTRYKKAIGKYRHGAHWVSVSWLRSHEGGMLDPDDLICDVCDDREQLMAIFDEHSSGHAGDGMSSDQDAFAGTAANSSQQQVFDDGGAELAQQQVYGAVLQVRRGSDPTLNQGSKPQPGATSSSASYRQFTNATPLTMLDDHNHLQQQHFLPHHGQQQHPYAVGGNDSETYDSLPDSTLGVGGAVGVDSKGSLHVLRRREPLGASAGNKQQQGENKGKDGDRQQQWSVAPQQQPQHDQQQQQHQFLQQQMVRPSVEVVIPNEIGPLGIHVVPSRDEGPGPLIVQGIEPGGRVDRDGRLAVGDEIMEINGYSLTAVSFAKAQEIFKEALFAKELKLRVVKGISDVVAANAAAAVAAASAMEVGGDVGGGAGNLENKENNVPPAGTAPADVVGCKVTAAVQANNTRKIGRVISITLTKGAAGLGFSITTRDNAPGGHTPIYIKNIMPKGAAIEEGTLKPGDRLLEVNGTSVDGMSQAEVVAMLRNAELNSKLHINVSRHSPAGATAEPDSNQGTLKTVRIREEPKEGEGEDDDQDGKENEEPMKLGSPPSHVQQHLGDGGDESSGSGMSLNFPWKQREILTFDIPVHDSELAGLGVSVKGKTSTNSDGGVIDLGIFVKSVLHGGAASRDGRLRTNDQLVNINGASLLGKPNPQAMETLRKAMHEEGPMPGIISLTVARQAADGGQKQHHSKKSLLGAFDRSDAKRASSSSQVTSSSDDLVREYSVSAPVFKAPQVAAVHRQQQTGGGLAGRNPVIDRLMGKESAGIVPSNMRNESYYMATHDTWNAGPGTTRDAASGPGQTTLLECPTVHQLKGESLMIEQDSSQHDASSATTRSDSAATAIADATRGSVASLSDGVSAFARDQPGRQSMSEKRHATLDAKATDTYQKRKKARDDRLRMQQQEHKALRWKKSASVESLHLIGAAEAAAARGASSAAGRGAGHQLQYLTPEEREALKTQYVRASSVRVSRSRGCNESFRQAVDRSYDRTLPMVEGQQDYEIEDEEEDEEVAGVVGGPAGSVNKSTSSSASAKKKNKNSKLLRNFGAMFRFGSGGRGSAGAGGKHHPHRKSTPNTPTPAGNASSSSLPVSQSVPNYQTYNKSRSGGELPPGESDFVRPYQLPQQHHHQQQQQQPRPDALLRHRQHQQQHPQFYPAQHPPPQQQQETYDYLPSAMMRPGSRVGIADPLGGAGAGGGPTSDYEVIQRHLHRTRVGYSNPPPPPTQAEGLYQPQFQQQQQKQQQQQQQQQQQPRVNYRHPRSHSNPSRARPKSNFYEYDNSMWSGSATDFQQQQQPPPPPNRPPVPRKPSDVVIQQHFSNVAATDPYLYGVTMRGSIEQQQQQQQHRQQQQADPYGYIQQQHHRPRAASSMEPQLMQQQHFSQLSHQQQHFQQQQHPHHHRQF